MATSSGINKYISLNIHYYYVWRHLVNEDDLLSTEVNVWLTF